MTRQACRSTAISPKPPGTPRGQPQTVTSHGTVRRDLSFRNVCYILKTIDVFTNLLIKIVFKELHLS